MFTIQGKYGAANVMIDNVDSSVVSQVLGVLNVKALATEKVVIMPDCHSGKGCVIGFTQKVCDAVCPSIVGVDIGCGMTARQLPEKTLDCQRLDHIIRKVVPSGFSIHETAYDNTRWMEDAEVILYHELSKKVGQRDCKAIESLGTLGGGNHFIEVDRADDGTLWLVVHSGSRNLGLRVAEYHQDIARHSASTGTPKGMEFLTGVYRDAYLEDMSTAQRYAERNRQFIIRRILASLYGMEKEDADQGMTQCVHNYISFEDHIIRKGAISAKAGEQVIIPLNMRDGIIFGRGKGNPEWNNSAPHGAGRILSRGQAKRQLTVSAFKETMKDVWTSCVSEATLDESPMAYKPMSEIMAVIGDTVDITFVGRPIYNFKAS